MAFNLTVIGTFLELDKIKYSERLKKHIQICFREGIRAAVRAAAGPQFPIQTGMALASWKKVGQALAFGKRIGVGVNITPIRNAEVPRTNFPKGKSIEAGLETSRPVFEEEGFRFRFRLSAGAFHYRRGLFSDVVPSLIRARNAYRRTFLDCFRRKFPKLRPSIRTRVRIGQ